jgi:hypothetical protein
MKLITAIGRAHLATVKFIKPHYIFSRGINAKDSDDR